MVNIIKPSKSKIKFIFTILVSLILFCSFLDYEYQLKGLLLVVLMTIMILYLKIDTNINHKLLNLDFNFLLHIILIIIAVNVFFNTLIFTFSDSKDILNYDFQFLLKYLFVFPFLEEILFRKKIFNLINQQYSFKRSLLLTSIGFAICHYFSDSGLIFVFIFSMLITWIYYVFGNLKLCVFLHFLNNLLTYLIFSYDFKNLLNQFSNITLSSCFLLFILLFINLRKKIKKIYLIGSENPDGSNMKNYHRNG